MSDLFVYFYEKSVNLLKKGGILSFISSNKYFRSGYGEKLRQFLSKDTCIKQIIDFGDAPVFSSIAYPSIILLAKEKSDGNEVQALNWQPEAPIDDFKEVFQKRSFLITQKVLTSDGWRLETPAVLRLLEKLRKSGKPLGEYVNGRFYRGILTGLNEAFVIDRATRDRLIKEHKSSSGLLKPFLRGRDVKRWRVDFQEQYLIKIESSENKSHPWSGKSNREAEKVFAGSYSAIHNHLMQFRQQLIDRDDQGRYFWELRSCSYWQEFEQPKIIYPDIAQTSAFTLDIKNYYLANTLYLIPRNNMLLGLLNSKAIFWLYTKISSQIRGGFVRFIAQYVSQLPIPDANATAKQNIEKIVTNILKTKQGTSGSDVSGLESDLNDHIYHLFNLTPDEIKIIEDSFDTSKLYPYVEKYFSEIIAKRKSLNNADRSDLLNCVNSRRGKKLDNLIKSLEPKIKNFKDIFKITNELNNYADPDERINDVIAELRAARLLIEKSFTNIEYNAKGYDFDCEKNGEKYAVEVEFIRGPDFKRQKCIFRHPISDQLPKSFVKKAVVVVSNNLEMGWLVNYKKELEELKNNYKGEVFVVPDSEAFSI